MKKLATQEMQRARKTKLYNNYRGAMSEKGVVKKLTGEYNTKARVRAEDNKFTGINEWEHYLYGKYFGNDV